MILQYPRQHDDLAVQAIRHRIPTLGRVGSQRSTQVCSAESLTLGKHSHLPLGGLGTPV